MAEERQPDEPLELTVIVWAGNGEDGLNSCLASLVSQSGEVFALGRAWELLVAEASPNSRTAEIARRYAGVEVITAGAPAPGWLERNHALWVAAQRARGRWLLFTTAAAVHEPGSLARALHEAARHQAGMMSYAPRQLASGFAQRTLLPLIFSELALAYPPAKVSDSKQRVAAADEQFLLVERAAYRRIGGHASVADKALAAMELAGLAKRRGVGLRFRYADDALSARLFRSAAEMVENWSGSLALLFGNCLALACWRALDFVLLLGLPVLAVWLWNAHFAAHSLQWLGAGWVMALLWVRNLFRFYGRVAKSSFSFMDCALSPLGLPLFVVLLCRSWFRCRVLKRVS